MRWHFCELFMEGNSLSLFAKVHLALNYLVLSLRFLLHMMQKDYPKSSADVAGDRKFDVYMGIDVFGRGTYGGGQWTVGFNALTMAMGK